VRERIKEKKNAYAALAIALQRKKKKLGRLHIRLQKKLAKKAITIAKNKAYEMLSQKLGTREGEKGVFKLARLREKKRRDLRDIRCIKDEDGKVLVEETKIRER